jgi:hypothetical protein
VAITAAFSMSITSNSTCAPVGNCMRDSVKHLSKGMLFSFVDSSLYSDMLTVIDIGTPLDERRKPLPGIALMVRMPDGTGKTFALASSFEVYLPKKIIDN